MNKTKLSMAISLFKEGEIKKSLKMFSKFRYGIDSDIKRTLEIAYESLAGKSGFYSSLGIDVDMEILKAKKFIKEKYL